MINNPVVPTFNNASTIAGLVSAIILWGMVIAGILTLLYLVMGGIEWIASGGDKAGLEHARGRITNSLIGLGLAVSVWAIMSIISTFLGLTFPCFPIPTISGANQSTCPQATTNNPTAPPAPGSGTCTIKTGSCVNSTLCPNLCVCDFGNCRPQGCSGLSESSCWGHSVPCKWETGTCKPR